DRSSGIRDSGRGGAIFLRLLCKTNPICERPKWAQGYLWQRLTRITRPRQPGQNKAKQSQFTRGTSIKTDFVGGKTL
ncbi:MAG: hypothetical protein JSU70_17805, partial [Phycisphaerales bacterium]